MLAVRSSLPRTSVCLARAALSSSADLTAFYGEDPRLASREPRRVVVTGRGLVSPLGHTVSSSWEALLAGKSGLRRLDSLSHLQMQVAAPVELGEEEGQLNAKPFLTNPRAQSEPFVQYAMVAAEEALAESGGPPETDAESERFGLAVGSGIGGMSGIAEGAKLVDDPRGLRRLSPYWVPSVLINLAAGNIGLKYNMRGPTHSAVTACATGTHSIGDAFRFIKYGDADRMLAGGTECGVDPISVAGFSRLRALATGFNEDPEAASRPFDEGRTGFVPASGAGMLVLEELEHAKARGAPIFAEVVGYGLSGCAYHITAPSADGNGARRAMRAALVEAALPPSAIDYINAHATSTPVGDAIEVTAVKDLFGEHASELAMSSTKGATGHGLGAAGAFEAIFAVKALEDAVMPPTRNLDKPSEGMDLNLVPNTPQEKKLGAVISNSFGFGGTNASLCFTAFEE